jgi:hypothetical protein
VDARSGPKPPDSQRAGGRPVGDGFTRKLQRVIGIASDFIQWRRDESQRWSLIATTMPLRCWTLVLPWIAGHVD